MSQLTTLFEVLASLWIVCYVIVYIAHTKGKGVCKNDESEKLTIEDYDKVILLGILHSKTYKYRSKCKGYWYKCYLHFQLLSTFKVFISSYLNIYALILVIPDIQDSQTVFYISVVWGYLLGLGVLFYRIHRLVLHYPFICPANIKNQSFDTKILPYLVWNAQTGALSSCAVEFINTVIGFMVIRQDPSTSITLLVIIAISFSLIFAAKNAYSQLKFFWRASTGSYFEFGYNEQLMAIYDDLVELQKLYLTAMDVCGLRYVICVILYVLWMVIVLIVFGICTYCSFQSDYIFDNQNKNCGIFDHEVWIWCTISGLLVLPFSPLIAYGGFYLKWRPFMVKSWICICFALAVVFGSIYVNKNGTDKNVEIYVTAICLVVIGSCCCLCGCCLVINSYKNTNDANPNHTLVPMKPSNYQTTNDQGLSEEEMAKLFEILKQMDTKR